MKRLPSAAAKFWLSALFFFIATMVANAQTITGKILDESGKPMSGVSVAEKGTSKGVTSNTDGAYSIAVSSLKAVLVFSYVGYSPKEILAGDVAVSNVVLAVDDLKRMEQVVVVGYGTQRRKDLTGAVGSVSSKDIEKIPTSGVDKALQGPGGRATNLHYIWSARRQHQHPRAWHKFHLWRGRAIVCGRRLPGDQCRL
jgi:hypothetical protein